MASKLSQQQAHLDLLIIYYLWALRLYWQERAHIQHHRVILVSFAWCSFAVGVSDRTKKGCTLDGELSWYKTKNTKL